MLHFAHFAKGDKFGWQDFTSLVSETKTGLWDTIKEQKFFPLTVAPNEKEEN